MTEADAARGLREERAYISHTLLENGFGGMLVPGWRDERLTDADIVLRALRGDPEGCEVVENALRYWREEVCPELDHFVASIPDRYGFVTGTSWEEAVRQLRDAEGTIASLGGAPGRGGMALPVDRARAFWAACDAVREFLKDVRTKSAVFFLRWDPNRFTRSGRV